MNTAKKAILITAAVITVIGAVIFVCAMSAASWDFTVLGSAETVTNTYNINESFSEISIDTQTADILFVLSEDGKCVVECKEKENVTNSVSVENGKLVIKTVDSRKWYEHVGFDVGKETITVFLPQNEYASLRIKESTGDIKVPEGFVFGNADISLSTGDVTFSAEVKEKLKIKSSTGDVRISKTSASVLDVSVTTGDVTVTDLTGDDFTFSGSTGDLRLKNAVFTGKMNIKSSTGDVSFDRCDAAEIYAKTSTGDVKGTLASEKIFITDTSTGSVKVPKTASGGKCEITTSTGDIKIDVEE